MISKAAKNTFWYSQKNLKPPSFFLSVLSRQKGNEEMLNTKSILLYRVMCLIALYIIA